MNATGGLLKHFRPALLLLTVAVCSVSAWAQSDPKPIPQNGGDAQLITLTNPNPTVTMSVAPNSSTNPCPLGSALCADFNFQNATGKTITTITMFFATQGNYVFNCPGSQDMLSAVFFDNCSQSAVSKGEDITFSADMKNGFDGVKSAKCVSPDTAALLNPGCSGEGEQYVGGLFAIDLYGSDLINGTSITTTAITTPEPGAGLLVLFSALAFALFRLVRRAV